MELVAEDDTIKVRAKLYVNFHTWKCYLKLIYMNIAVLSMHIPAIPASSLMCHSTHQGISLVHENSIVSVKRPQ